MDSDYSRPTPQEAERGGELDFANLKVGHAQAGLITELAFCGEALYLQANEIGWYWK